MSAKPIESYVHPICIRCDLGLKGPLLNLPENYMYKYFKNKGLNIFAVSAVELVLTKKKSVNGVGRKKQVALK